jgi:hypothetical protein
MAMLPHERSLVERLQDKPFALLGVSADPSPEAMKRAQDRHKITWRSWWDSGPIRRKFDVPGFPYLFLLDAEGIIRKEYRGRPRDADLERDVNQLVREAEESKRKSAQQRGALAGGDS